MISNLRDVTGTGVVLRSASWQRFDPTSDVDVVALGVRTLVDLRTVAERAEGPDVLPANANLINADVLAGHDQADPAQLLRLLADPQAAAQVLGDGKAEEQIRGIYRAFVLSPNARQAYHVLFTAMADPQQRPLVFHCTAGKDRTGWAAAVLLLLRGMSEADVMQDYLASNAAVQATFGSALDRFIAAGGDPALILPALEVRETYLQAALDAMYEEHGDVESYLTDLGLEAKTIAALKEL